MRSEDSPAGASNMSTSAKYEYKSAIERVTCATILIVAYAIISAFAAFSTVAEIALVDAARSGQTIAPAVAEAHDGRQDLITKLQLGIGLAAAVAFLAWVYRSNCNAHAFGTE